MTHYADRLAEAIDSKRTAAVVGLDPLLDRLPAELTPAAHDAESAADAVERFCREVIDIVAPLVPAVKINIAFFEPLRAAGIAAFDRLVEHAHARDLLVIADVKRGDIGSTAALYARACFDPLHTGGPRPAAIPDAVTLAGYLGEGAVRPFIEMAVRDGRGLYILVRPSDPGADEVHEFGGPARFYEHMAALVRRWGAADAFRGRCGLSCVGAVVAPKDVESTRRLRASLPHTPLLVPGYGAQGGTPDQCIPCFLAGGSGAVINASRSVIFAFDRPDPQWRQAVRRACTAFASEIARCMSAA